MIVKLCLCILFSIYNNITDWRNYRVRNKAVVVFCLMGVAAGIYENGLVGLGLSLAGGAVMLCLFPIFALRMLGAGDIKALIAIGCILRFPLGVKAMVFSFLGGGIIAVFALAARGDGRDRLKYLWDYIVKCFCVRGILPYGEETGAGGRFHFTFGITVGLAMMIIFEFKDCLI